MTFSFESYSDKSFILRASTNNVKTHPDHRYLIGHLQGRWNQRAQGWLISKGYEKELTEWVNQKNSAETGNAESVVSNVEPLEEQPEKEPEKEPIKEPLEEQPVKKVVKERVKKEKVEKEVVKESIVNPTTTSKLDEIQSHIKSRHQQNKYHRSISSGEGEEDDIIKAKALKDVSDYCRQFTRPIEIKQEEDDKEYEYSSSSSNSSTELEPTNSMAFQPSQPVYYTPQPIMYYQQPQPIIQPPPVSTQTIISKKKKKRKKNKEVEALSAQVEELKNLILSIKK